MENSTHKTSNKMPTQPKDDTKATNLVHSLEMAGVSDRMAHELEDTGTFHFDDGRWESAQPPSWPWRSSSTRCHSSPSSGTATPKEGFTTLRIEEHHMRKLEGPEAWMSQRLAEKDSKELSGKLRCGGWCELLGNACSSCMPKETGGSLSLNEQKMAREN
ncbi:hypothetical protein M501DRAFT_992577 [Patellaria atrata CBS 101060]|uniref:Uncharacterized protein n=1 Tax=Patellaria atrata CBS 101060 TaxID=1346257 RepID=A0A9P4S9J5_9PEZI|nr:hypothetical protein M501DRAFT_992577 [Patellaria atrata CBS 101060]